MRNMALSATVTPSAITYLAPEQAIAHNVTHSYFISSWVIYITISEGESCLTHIAPGLKTLRGDYARNKINCIAVDSFWRLAIKGNWNGSYKMIISAMASPCTVEFHDVREVTTVFPIFMV